MIVARSLDELGDVMRPSAVTIGKFNAIHRGHLEMIGRSRQIAEERGLHAVVVTFDRHPASLFTPDSVPLDITGAQRRVELIGHTGVEACLVLPFTAEIASLSPADFVSHILIEGLGAQCVIVGKDFRFGHRAAGDVDTLRELGAAHGFDVVLVDDVTDESGNRIASSLVRRFIIGGDVASAAHALGRTHAMQGEVVHGEAKGREFGYPTANLSKNATGLMPGDGVYAGWLITEDGNRYPSAISVGNNPTIEGERERVVEAHCFVPPGDLYGQIVVIEFVDYIRGMLKFDDLDDLIWQMGKDVETIAARLGVSV
jgi:riboflavin kinase/FMN adenylyltransferase